MQEKIIPFVSRSNRRERVVVLEKIKSQLRRNVLLLIIVNMVRGIIIINIKNRVWLVRREMGGSID